LLFLFFTFTSLLPAQQPIFKSYTVQDGLVTNHVRRIFQDSKGSIWIGTLEGISQFNGYQFINYSTSNGLSNSVVNDFVEIDGKMLVALNDGTICAIQNGKISSVAKTSPGLSAFSSFLKFSNGRIIASTMQTGFYEFRNGSFFKPKQQFPNNGFDFIVPFNDTLLAGPTNTANLALVTHDYRIILDTLLPFTINSIYRDSHHRVWLCTGKGLLLASLDKNNKIIVNNDLPIEFNRLPVAGTNVLSFLETTDGEFWIGTTKGLFRLSPDGKFSMYTDNDGLACKYVSTIFCDREKNIWAGTIEGVTRIVRRNNIQTFQLAGDLSEDFLRVMIPWKKNELLLMTGDRPLIFNNQTNGFSEFKFDNKQRPVYFFPGTKPLLYATVSTLGHFDSVQNRITRLKSDSIICNYPQPCTDKKGNAFLNLYNGIAFISGKKVWIHKKPTVMALTIDKQGYLWAGTWSSGLYRIQYSFTKDSVLLAVKDFSQLLADKFIRSLFTDSEGNIWVGCRYKGVARLTPKNNDEYTVTTFDQKNGLASDFIKSFAETPTGDIWVGSLIGLDKLIKEGNGFRVFNFSRINNLYGVFLSMVDMGNDEWVCNVTNKLVKFTDHKLENTPPLKVEISMARFGGAKDNISSIKTDTVITLKHFQNQANFEFSAPDFINEKQVLYAYRLIGSNDTTWSEPRNIHQVSYASLQPGHYNFEVRTIGWNNQPGESTKVFFIIKTPFWKTWWFIVVLSSIFLLIVYRLYRYRVNQLSRLQQVRNRIATDLHDDIGSTLTNISILTELSRRNKKEPEKAEAYLDRISEEIDASGQALDDIIWSVNTKNDTLQEIATRMRRYAAELFDARNVKYELTMDTQIADKKIKMEQRRDLFLIFKETLNNIHKHAAATSVSISLFIQNENIKLIISDNGKGFDTTQPTHRNGISNMKDRVSRWNGAIAVESGNGHGTTVNVQLPLSGITQKRD